MTAVRIREVGPRDGLQNEATPIPTETKLAFIRALMDSGLPEIEVTSFVSPKWVPQLADAAELVPQLPPELRAWVLVPNAKGLERARAVGAYRIAVLTAASSAFTERNLNMTRDEATATALSLLAERGPNDAQRVYVSTVFDCPYAGRVPLADVLATVRAVAASSADEISLGDTIGTATPGDVRELAQALLREGIAPQRIWWHFHDTRGTALANVYEALHVSSDWAGFDSSAAGLGGCPYAPGAAGNLATEDLVYALERDGMATGVNLDRLARASEPILAQLLRTGPGSTGSGRASSRVQRAILAAER
ncbi:MAG: hydroxymethylglutaryl-CoA lyase [Fimbriimonadaceae bacterium]|nr:hydroxymethylglutaryl-CoA lyase [Fimbriimonadaceae bacterium]